MWGAGGARALRLTRSRIAKALWGRLHSRDHTLGCDEQAVEFVEMVALGVARGL